MSAAPRISEQRLRAAAISLDPTVAELARQRLDKRMKQRKADKRFRKAHLAKIRERERVRIGAWRAKNIERIRAQISTPEYKLRSKLLRHALATHRETGRPLTEIHAELGVQYRLPSRCKCEVCK